MTILPPKSASIPPLNDGDRLTRHEFERRYFAMPHVKKAQLIEGVVYMPSPVSYRHARGQGSLGGLLLQYEASTPGAAHAPNATLRLDDKNEPQPDCFLRILESHGGQSRVDDDGYILGVPELVVEVAVSSASIDLREKLEVYRRSGVREHLVWRPRDQEIDWFIARHGAFEKLNPGTDGIFRSEAFPGLWLDVAALARDDTAGILRCLHQGLATPEHVAFVARLAANRDAIASRHEA